MNAISMFAGFGVLCFLGMGVLLQELLRVALDLRNANGTYTLGVGWLRLSYPAALGVQIYWASHAWLLFALWRITRKARPRAEWIVTLFVTAAIVAVRFLLYSAPLNQMLIRPWIR